MSQSLAHLIKNKIFLGSSPSPTRHIEDDRRKKDKKWGRKKDNDGNGNEVLESPTNNGMRMSDTGLSPLSSIGEEGRGENGNYLETVEIDELDEDSESSEEGELEGADQGDLAAPYSPVKGGAIPKKPSKLQMLKSRISIPDLSFKSSAMLRHHSSNSSNNNNNNNSNNNNHHHHNHRRQRSLEKVSPNLQTSSSFVSTSPSGFASGSHRPSHERSMSGWGSVYRLGSNSSASSSRFFCSPKRNHAGSVSRGTPNGGNNNNKTGGLNTSKSGTLPFIRGHGRNRSMEMKPVKPQPISIGRKRSKTLDTYDDYKRGRDNTSELLSTINAHLSRSRSGSMKSKSPSLKAQEPTVVGVADRTSPPTITPSIGGVNCCNGSIPFPPGMLQPQLPMPLPGRRSSIVNAFNNFVNFPRSLSTTSSRGLTTPTNNSKLELSQTQDLPPPPEPLEDEIHEDYLVKLMPFGNEIGPILTETDTSFKRECLHLFLLHHFDFADCPLDIAMRILLIFLKLPKEAQQIDRLLIEFSKVYYEVQGGKTGNCPFWADENQLYFITFSLLMLHTDHFNPKNKFKMTKNEFINLIHEDKESSGYKVPIELLSYFYDNITAKEFPKFAFIPQSPPESAETSESESYQDTLKYYSPLGILRSQSSVSNPELAPLTVVRTDRASSNSFSSYLTHGPTSGSSSSLAQDDVDIYGHIFENTLSSLSLQPSIQRTWDRDYMFELFNGENKYNKYFSMFKEAKGGYLRLHKTSLQKLCFPSFDVLNSSNDDSTCMNLRIFQMGEIEQLTLNRKFSIVGSGSKMIWKKQLGILTSCGLLIFDHHDWIDPVLIKDEHTGTSNYIINYHPSSAMVVEPPIPLKGLLAVNKSHRLLRQSLTGSGSVGDETEGYSAPTNIISHVSDGQHSGDVDDNCIMRLYGSQRAKIWKCSSPYERDNWIDAINLVAACDGCYIDSITIPNTVVSARMYDVGEKVKRLQFLGREKQRCLQESENLLSLYGQTIPICTKTRNELLFHVKQLAVTMEWLVYEIKRGEMNLKILEQLGSQTPDDSDEGIVDTIHNKNESDGGNMKHQQHQQHQQQYIQYPTDNGVTHVPISSPADRPFILDTKPTQKDFPKKQDAIVYKQIKSNDGEVLASYF